MQVAAGMQGDGRVVGADRHVRHHVLQAMGRGQAVMVAQGLARGDQGRVVFEAGQLLAGLQQAAAEVAFASAPVQPVGGCFGEIKRSTEGFDLLPLAARYVDVQPMARGCKRVCR
ncbi:hypothetical protein PSFL6913_29070 [Pseudomonas fluorescens]